MSKTEVRVALVMNGGVSLAVWMGGVAHEIDLLRRASRGLAPPPEGHPDKAVYDGWAQLAEQLQLEVSVDVVAGASAGGLNGTLLATSIARGAPLPDLRQVWSDAAQLSSGRLLRERGSDALPSVLNGDFFGDEVRRVIDAIAPVDGETKAEGDPVTLFVTATALGDHKNAVVDTYGNAFAVADHRRVYCYRRDPSRLAYQPPGAGPDGPDAEDAAVAEADVESWLTDAGTDEFGPDHAAALARTARASAGFPVAFAPVREVDEDVDLREQRILGSGTAWLMDGGVLDNAPFDPVLSEIAARPVDRPWHRVLAYVVPSGGGEGISTGGQARQSPDRPGWASVVGAAMGLPREADLRSDVERLTALSREAHRWAQEPQRLFRELREADGTQGGGESEPLAAARALLLHYRRARLDGGLVDALWLWADVAAQRPVTVPDLPDQDPDDAPTWVPALSALDDADIGGPVWPWTWGSAVADRTLRLMLRDTGAVAAGREAEGSPIPAEVLADTLGGLSSAIAGVTALRGAIEARISAGAPTGDEPALAIDVVNHAVNSVHSSTVLAALVRKGAEAYLTLLGEPPEPPEPPEPAGQVIRDALVVEVLTRAFAGRMPFARTVGFDFARFGPDVASPLISGVIGPGDAAPRPLSDWKLWGTQVNHFGAFGRARWREQDWLWGRLDGAAHLVRVLARSSRAVSAGRQTLDDWVGQQQQLVLDADGTTTEDVTDRLRQVVGLTRRQLLDDFRSDEEGQATSEDVVAAILRLLRSREAGIPPLVPRLGDWLTMMLADDLPDELHDEFKEHALRTAAIWPRRRFWRTVRGREEDGD